MIEMWVRTVDHDPRSGWPVVVLLPRVAGGSSPLALPISPADACTLSHELESLTTLRTRAFMLLDQALASIQGYPTDIVLTPGPDGTLAGRVDYWHPGGRLEAEIDVSLALGLVAHLGFAVQVAESLVPAGPPSRSVAPPPGDQTSPTPDTLAVFRQAFDD